jgi:hypothetical protein
MGTRADFYIGRGKDAEWLGSIAWDGYPDGLTADSDKCAEDLNKVELLAATDGAGFRDALTSFLATRDDATYPNQGWPWPWNDSRTTDYAYAFDGGKVWASSFGGEWFDPLLPEPEDDEGEKVAVFPNMKQRKSLTLGKRSGLTTITVHK